MSENKLFNIIAKVFNVSINQINYQSNPENIENWDSFTGYILLDEIESEFNVNFTMEESLQIKKIEDFKIILKEKGIDIEKE
jgi:acyl carrier protein